MSRVSNQPTPPRTQADVLIIGSGPAGIASAYFLQQAGIPFRIIDQADEIGATWANLYPSLQLNTTRFYSHLPGKRFPLRCGLFPTAQQYHQHLLEFVQEHAIQIELGITVEQAVPLNGGWWVETSAGDAWYPALISATGRFSNPYWPTFPGMDGFQGHILHAHDYLGPEPFTGKRVMVVGNGPSGVDIVTELGPYTDGPALLSQRTGVVLRPRYPLGVPKHLWMMLAERLPEKLGKALEQRMLDIKFTGLDRLGIKVPTNEADSTAAAGTRGRELIDAVKAGYVRAVEGLTCFLPDSVVLADGSRLPMDVVILATGYRPALYSYLDLDAPQDKDGWPLRVDEDPQRVWTGKRQVAGYPGLYLVGNFYQGKGAMYNFNVEAEAAVEEIQAQLADA